VPGWSLRRAAHAKVTAPSVTESYSGSSREDDGAAAAAASSSRRRRRRPIDCGEDERPSRGKVPAIVVVFASRKTTKGANFCR
jgi:hypothetical protein